MCARVRGGAIIGEIRMRKQQHNAASVTHRRLWQLDNKAERGRQIASDVHNHRPSCRAAERARTHVHAQACLERSQLTGNLAVRMHNASASAPASLPALFQSLQLIKRHEEG